MESQEHEPACVRNADGDKQKEATRTCSPSFSARRSRAMLSSIMAAKAIFIAALQKGAESLAALGFIGYIYFILFLAVYTALLGPTTPVELAWGFHLRSNLLLSTVTCVLGKSLGNMLALLIGRWFLKPLMSDVLVRSIGSTVYQHIISELKLRPLQTMSILRAAPLPTPFKIYGLSILPTELVPAGTYACIAVVFNTCWSLVWCLGGSSMQDLADPSGASSGALVSKIVMLVGLFGMCVQFARFSKAQLQVPPEQASEPSTAASGMVANASASTGRSTPRQQRRSKAAGLTAAAGTTAVPSVTTKSATKRGNRLSTSPQPSPSARGKSPAAQQSAGGSISSRSRSAAPSSRKR